jgi:hypothetical protein
VLLFRGYARSGLRLLLWSALCFVSSRSTIVLLFFDLIVVLDELDLRPWRLAAALAGLHVSALTGFLVRVGLAYGRILSGAVTLGFLVAAGFFFRFWRKTRRPACSSPSPPAYRAVRAQPGARARVHHRGASEPRA